MKKRYKITKAFQVSKSLDAAYGDLMDASAIKDDRKYYLTINVCKDCSLNEDGTMVKLPCCKLEGLNNNRQHDGV